MCIAVKKPDIEKLRLKASVATSSLLRKSCGLLFREEGFAIVPKRMAEDANTAILFTDDSC